MNRVLSSIISVVFCLILMVSCKNKSQEPSIEEFDESMPVIADSIIVINDAIAQQYQNVSDDFYFIHEIEPTETEKLIKPDYLLEPSAANTLITKSQKVNAIAIYVVEMAVRQIYDMPTDEVKATILKLAADVDYAMDEVFLDNDEPLSEQIQREYELCREKNDIATFWQFQDAILTEYDYLFANNVEVFFDKVDEQKFVAWASQIDYLYEALGTLADYDRQVAELYEMYSDKMDLWKNVFQTLESSRQFYQDNKEECIEWRNDLLK